ncbi:MAG TPA: hypothetical protein VJT31_01395 [Rugosimonospora sp.]|nr:hypothetical protein [Rugosimonospora sp.]
MFDASHERLFAAAHRFPPHLAGLDDATFAYAKLVEPEIEACFLETLGRDASTREFRICVRVLTRTRGDRLGVPELASLLLAELGNRDELAPMAQRLAWNASLGVDIFGMQPNMFWAEDIVATSLAQLPEPARERARSITQPAYARERPAITHGFAVPSPLGGGVLLLHGGATLVPAFTLHAQWSLQRYQQDLLALSRDLAGEREVARFCVLAREFLGYRIVPGAIDAERAEREFVEHYEEAEVEDTEGCYRQAELALVFLLLHEYGHILLNHFGRPVPPPGRLEREADAFAVAHLFGGAVDFDAMRALVGFFAHLVRAQGYGPPPAGEAAHDSYLTRLRRIAAHGGQLTHVERTFLDIWLTGVTDTAEPRGSLLIAPGAG